MSKHLKLHSDSKSGGGPVKYAICVAGLCCCLQIVQGMMHGGGALARTCSCISTLVTTGYSKRIAECVKLLGFDLFVITVVRTGLPTGKRVWLFTGVEEEASTESRLPCFWRESERQRNASSRGTRVVQLCTSSPLM